MTWKYYVVAVGRNPGIYQDWDTVKNLVSGYSGAIYKGFKSLNEAQLFLQPYAASTSPATATPTTVATAGANSTAGAMSTLTVSTTTAQATSQYQTTTAPPSPIPLTQKVIAYTDGSFRDNSSGYGVVLVFPTSQVIHGYGHVPLSVGNTNNVAELYAIYAALSAVPNSDMDIYTDSDYSKAVITGTKRAKVNLELIAHIKSKMTGRKVSISHVYGHSGVHLNEVVDNLANLGSTQTNDEIIWFQPYHETGGGATLT